MFNQVRLVHLVRNLGDDDRVFVLSDVLDGGLGAHHKAASSGAIGLGDAAAAVNESAGGKVRSLHELQHVGQGGVRIVYQRNAGIDDLGEIVRRDVGSHADRNAIRPVHQQIRNSCGEHHRLDRGVIEIGNEVDGVFIDVGQQLLGNLGQARLGVPVGRWRVAVNRAKVSLPIDQRVAQAPGLSQADHRVIDGAIAMRVILLQTLADDAGALHVLAIVQHSHVMHGVQNATMHRLEAVAYVRQRAPDNDRHRIVEIRTPHLVFNVDGLHIAGAGADVAEG